MIGIIGLGYVGATLAVFLSEKYKKNKICIKDIDVNKTFKVLNGIPHLSEPHYEEYLLKSKNKFSNRGSMKEFLHACGIIFICVGTPSNDDGSINLDYIWDIAEEIGQNIPKPPTNYKNVFVIKSTTIPGTCKKFSEIIETASGLKRGKDFDVIFNPEFLQEGNAFYNLNYPDKIVLGGKDEKSFGLQAVIDFYQEVYSKKILEEILFVTGWENAELIKYANNTFLATKITFINQIANICEKIPGANIKLIAEAIGMDARIDPKFLRAGIGFGGSCFTKDLLALSHFAKCLGVSSHLLETVHDCNVYQRVKPVEKYLEIYPLWERRKIAILGVSFKPDTDDVRDAPSIDIIREFLCSEVDISVYDPLAMANLARSLKLEEKERIIFAESAKHALKDAHYAVICTEWKEFEKLEPEDFTLLMKEPNVYDGRRIVKNPEIFIKSGVKYYGIGYG